jgi:hypothetical protein
MNIVKVLVTMSLSCIAITSIGCGSSTQSHGSKSTSSPYFAIQTITTKSTEPWKNVSISGYADTSSLASVCTPSDDANCIAEVGGPFLYAATQNAISAFATDSNGRANFYTNAQPAIWKFYASGPDQTDCSSTSASAQTYQDEPDGSPVLLSCGSSTASMIASPSSCITTVDQYGGFIKSTCPDTVALSFPVTSATPMALPIKTSLTVVNYSETGTNLFQETVTASSTSSINVPTPVGTGLNYIAIQNPSTGDILGVSEFTNSTRIYKCSYSNCD